MKIFFKLGETILSLTNKLENFGSFLIFCAVITRLLFTKPRYKDIAQQIYVIGISTTGVIVLIAFFTGMVESIQLYKGFHEFGVEGFMGYTIFLSIAKELGPVFGTLMVISRAVSSMSAELGTMRVTEQIDAIETLGFDSKKILIVPRIIATIISMPILIVIFNFVANLSAYAISTSVLHINPITYQSIIVQNLTFADLYTGIMIKGPIFGFLIALIGTYIGYNTKGGAKGVGIATTKGVVFASIAIFGANYFLSSIFLLLGL